MYNPKVILSFVLVLVVLTSICVPVNAADTSIPTIPKLPTVPILELTVPQPPTNLYAKNISTNSAQLTWSHEGGTTGFNVYYSTQKGSSRMPISPKKVSTTSNSITISNLKPSTTYYVMVKAYNNQGESKPSGVISFKTKSVTTIPQIPPTIITPEEQIIKPPIEAEPNDPTEPGLLLPPSLPKDELIIKPPVSVKPNPPTHLKLENAEFDSIEISWQYEGEVSGFNVYYSTKLNSNGLPTLPKKLGCDAKSITISNLNPSTTYYIIVKAYNNLMESDPSNLLEVKTREKVITPILPEKLVIKNDFSHLFDIEEPGSSIIQKNIKQDITAVSTTFIDSLKTENQNSPRIYPEVFTVEIDDLSGLLPALDELTPEAAQEEEPPEESQPQQSADGPELLAVMAQDLENDLDVIFFIFDTVTNRPEFSQGELQQAFTADSGSWGNSEKNIQWIPKESEEYGDVLAVVFPERDGVDMAVGETTFAVSQNSGISNPDTGSAAHGGPVALTGDFGPEPEEILPEEQAGPQLLGAFAYDLEEQGDAVLFIFDRTTNQPEIDSSKLENCFPTRNGSWGEGPHDIFWVPPESQEQGDTLAVIFHPESGVEMTVGETEIQITQASGITDTTESAPVIEGSAVLEGDFGPEMAANQEPHGRFADISNHWGKDYITNLVSYGITNGYPDNTFRPNNKLSRAEFYTFIIRTLYAVQLILSQGEPEGAMEPFVAEPKSTPYFDDSDGHWSSGYIDLAKNARIILPEEYSNRKFKPNINITRLEIAAAVVRAMGLQEYAEDYTAAELPFTDAGLIPENRKGYIKIAIDQGIITGYDTGEFKPQGEATRAETAAMLVRMVNKFLETE